MALSSRAARHQQPLQLDIVDYDGRQSRKDMTIEHIPLVKTRASKELHPQTMLPFTAIQKMVL